MIVKLDIDVFRFDCQIDYNEYYQNIKVDIDENLRLQELLEEISKKLDNFSYDSASFGFRINDIVVFSNIKINDLVTRFGKKLLFSPISIKYAKKDLLINKDAIFARYKPMLDKLTFLSEESKLEFKKYILLSLISPLDFDDYIGDGYCLYVKCMMIHYKDYADKLLDSISNFDGVLNSMSVKYMIYPPDGSIDNDIEGLQKMLLEKGKSNNVFLNKIIKEVESSYKKLSKQGL